MADIKTIARGLRLLRTTVDFPIHPPVEDPRTGDMLEPGTIEGWHFALSDMPDELFLAGIKAVMSSRTSGNFTTKPEPGDIRKAVEAVGNKGWAEAWNEIQTRGHLFNQGGHTLTSQGLVKAQWSTPEIAEAVSQMGGISICLSVTERELNTTRSQFRQIWEQIQARRQSKQYSALPQPPQAVPELIQPMLALSPGSNVIDINAKREQMAQAAHDAGIELVRQALEDVEARKLAEYQAKIAESQRQAEQAFARQQERRIKAAEQQRLAREMAAQEGIELITFNLPEVAEG